MQTGSEVGPEVVLEVVVEVTVEVMAEVVVGGFKVVEVFLLAARRGLARTLFVVSSRYISYPSRRTPPVLCHSP